MAVIRTGDTAELATKLVASIVSAFQAGFAVASPLFRLADKLAEIPQDQSSSAGGNDDGTQSWQTSLGSSSASHVLTHTDYPMSFPETWYRNAETKYVLSGFGLDTPDGVARQFTLSDTDHYQRNVAGFIGNNLRSERVSAVVDYSMDDMALLFVGNFTRESSSSALSSGFSQAPYQALGRTQSSALKVSEVFVGAAQFQSVDGTPELVDSWVSSYSYNFTRTVLDDGAYGEPGSSSASSGQFKLKSSAGLNYSQDQAGTIQLAGSVAALTLASKVVSRTGSAAPTSSEDLYRYVDSASPADDFDLAALEDYLNDNQSEINWEALLTAFYKANDTIVVTDHLGGGTIYAGAGNDKVTGGKAADTLYGDDGDDLLNGGDGDDFINGGDGHDRINGGNGNDQILAREGADNVLGGAGNDMLYGDAGNDYIDGGSGNDYIVGGDGDDVLKGGSGQDTLTGSAGNDYIDGGAGNDYITGGAGRDIMTGGSGLDAFRFGTGDSGGAGLALESLDQIKGFSISQDSIVFRFDFTDADIKVLSLADTALLGKSGSYAGLLTVAEAQDSKVVVAYDSGNTYVFADSDADGTLDLAIQLVGIKGDAVAQGLNIQQEEPFLE